jgi:hypothetical protein
MQYRLAREVDDVTLVDGGDHVFVKNVSLISGNTSWMSFPMNFAEFERRYNEWTGGAMVQEAFSNLSADQREFLMTGITSTEWDDAFGEEEKEETYYPGDPGVIY